MPRLHAAALLFCALVAVPAFAQSREQKVRADKAKVEADGFWIYNKLPQAFADAKSSGKPIIVVLRCIPCEECVKLDDELVDKDERLRPLLEQFVRVRVVSTNGLDLSLFQFDTDQSFAVFFLNADQTIYGRFGTRSSQKEWADDVSVAGLARALEGALALHQQYPANKAQFAAKRGAAPDFPVPESFPTLKGKYGSSLDYEGNVVRSCIHCHQIGDAQRDHHRARSGRIPATVLFPYPHPKAIGLILDPAQRATVQRVEPESPAARSGFQAGDVIEQLDGQPLLSIADVQWVLHHASPEGARLAAVVRRADASARLTLQLPAGWRQRDDIAWRASSWELRRFALGGMYLKPVSNEERETLNLDATKLALRIQHLGEYSPHDLAKRAGFRKGDVLVSFDGHTALVRESDLLEHAINVVKPGAEVPVVLLRDGQRLELKLSIVR